MFRRPWVLVWSEKGVTRQAFCSSPLSLCIVGISHWNRPDNFVHIQELCLSSSWFVEFFISILLFKCAFDWCLFLLIKAFCTVTDTSYYQVTTELDSFPFDCFLCNTMAICYFISTSAELHLLFSVIRESAACTSHHDIMWLETSVWVGGKNNFCQWQTNIWNV
jgi:hypothetical protein